MAFGYRDLELRSHNVKTDLLAKVYSRGHDYEVWMRNSVSGQVKNGTMEMLQKKKPRKR